MNKRRSFTGTILMAAAVILLLAGIAAAAGLFDQEEELRPLGLEDVPEEFIPVYEEAAEAYDIPWELLAAVHRVETIFSTMDPLESPVGAEGHLQFMPCTWTGWGHPTCEDELGEGNIPEQEKMDPDVIAQYGGYGVDASGNGTADPYNLEDAVHSAANYLAGSGAAEGRYEDAIYDYNRASWYVEDVMHYFRTFEAGYTAVEFDEVAVEPVDIDS
ncbi:lytic transglycosylase domain-containing protein [Alkalicoccus urumqiensis]|uniref:lytic transglycosylase domain-containing protein n=1 Tax=Alkalicoccus urumqiensis TaxID=1548213 RepID=UPI0015E5E387|nr:lytic transglycosylase domain-containing protein [Alkalicoccus urumqiensis]